MSDHGHTRGRRSSCAAARADPRRTAAAAGVRRRFPPHQLRHAHAVEMAHEGVPLIVIQRQRAKCVVALLLPFLSCRDRKSVV
jgi:integrase